jgi:hypothetical protein
MSEKEFFNHDGVVITSKRAVFRDTMYPIQSISAVKQINSEKFSLTNKGLAILLNSIVALVLLEIVLPNLVIIWLILAFILILYSFFNSETKVFYHIGLHTSGTNIQVYSTTDKREMEDIVKAINDAIIDRG